MILTILTDFFRSLDVKIQVLYDNVFYRRDLQQKCVNISYSIFISLQNVETFFVKKIGPKLQ